MMTLEEKLDAALEPLTAQGGLGPITAGAIKAAIGILRGHSDADVTADPNETPTPEDTPVPDAPLVDTSSLADEPATIDPLA